MNVMSVTETECAMWESWKFHAILWLHQWNFY